MTAYPPRGIATIESSPVKGGGERFLTRLCWKIRTRVSYTGHAVSYSKPQWEDGASTTSRRKEAGGKS